MSDDGVSDVEFLASLSYPLCSTFVSHNGKETPLKPDRYSYINMLGENGGPGGT
jgi:hypothetical protein